jgi:hypothetical protein
MNSFLKSIEKRFTLLNESIDLDANTEEHDVFEEEEELDEISTSAGAGAYLTPNAFSPADDDTVEALGYKRVKRNESVNTPPTYKPGEYQHPESIEEEWNDKFPFSQKKWYNAEMKYPSIDMTETPSRTREEDVPKNKPTRPLADIVGERLDSKYEELIESYKRFATGDSKSTPEQKVKHTIKEVAKKLQEVEQLVANTARLKTESGMSRDGYGKSVNSALTKISERLIKISERVRSLGE